MEVLKGHDGYPKERDKRAGFDLELKRDSAIHYTPEVAVHLDTLRSFFLGCHRRRVTQGGFYWIHQQPEYKPVGISDSYVVGLAGVVNPQEAEEGPVYEWTRLGPAMYTEWWHDRFKSHRKDLRAARDSLRR
jgi:hypothetical protein